MPQLNSAKKTGLCLMKNEAIFFKSLEKPPTSPRFKEIYDEHSGYRFTHIDRVVFYPPIKKHGISLL
jgi:hypothetical protein